MAEKCFLEEMHTLGDALGVNERRGKRAPCSDERTRWHSQYAEVVVCKEHEGEFRYWYRNAKPLADG